MAGRRPPRRGGAPAGRRFRLPPDGTVRQSQVVRTYGPGAMIDLVDAAVMVGGLDFWRYLPADTAAASVADPRLRDRLAPRFAEAGRQLAVEGCFRLPPTADDKDPTRASGIEVLELPRWFVC